jgi:hypothetical protein
MAESHIQDCARPCYVYAIVVDGVVRYIGFSCNPKKRFLSHLRVARRGLGARLGSNLRKAFAINAKVSVIILEKCRDKEAAAQREIEEIARLGGHGSKRQLWNAHSGGLGGASEASNSAVRKKWKDPEFVERVRKLAKAQLQRQRLDPAFEMARLKAISEAGRSEFGLNRLVKARQKIDREKQRMAAGLSCQKRWADPNRRIELKAKISEGAKRKWQDPAFREKQRASRIKAMPS